MYLDDVAGMLAVQAQGVPEPTLIRELRNAAMDFCRRTKAHRQTLIQEVTRGTAFVTLAPPVDTAIADVIYADFGGRQLTYLSDRGQVYRDVQNGVTQYITQSGHQEVQLLPVADRDATLTVRAALTLSFDASVIDDALVSEFNDALTAGALYRVFRVPSTDWHDRGLAGYYEAEYQRLCEDARLRANRDTSPVIRTVRYGGL